MVKKSSDGVDSSSSSSSSVAPFLRKCYEMVDDSSTDAIISWSTNGDNTFVISDPTVFSAQLLPKYFKHSNLASFIRQLNIYGFRKVDADRYEFANDWFVRDQKELLKNVVRRKNVQSSGEHQSKTTTTTADDASLEKKSGESELWKEVDILKGDKKALAQELVKVRQYQESTDAKMLHLEDRVQGMEESQQEMLSFLVMVMQNPSLLVQLLQPKENGWRKTEGGGGGATILEEVTDEGETTNSKGLPLVTYHQKTPAEGTAAKSSSNEMNDFLRNADMLKFCLDENRVPLIIPDLYDDGAWEKLLLLSPSKKKNKNMQEKNVKKGKDDVVLVEDEDEDGGRMELDKSLALELIEEEMEKADDFDIGQLTPERSRNLEILTQHMRLLASDQ